MLNLVPQNYWNDLFVAGGYAVNPATATDIDLWIVNQSQLSKVRREVLAHLRSMFVNEWITPESPDLEETHVVRGEEYPLKGIMKIATVQIDRDGFKPYHFIVTELTKEEVLSHFDLSIAQVGFDVMTGQVVKGDEFTNVFDQPFVVHDSATTPARLAKYLDRFQMEAMIVTE